MRKIFILLILIISINNIFGIEYNTYDMEVEHVFKASHLGVDSVDDLAINKHPGGEDASGPAIFFKNENLIVSDQTRMNMRTIILNKDYSFKKIVVNSFFRANIVHYDNVIIGMRFHETVNIFDQNFVQKSWLSYDNISFFNGYKDLYYKDNTLFITDNSYKLWGIRNPSLDINENKKNIMTEEEIIEEINSGKYKGLTIDSEKRLFLDGELQTIQYMKYILQFQNKKDIAGTIKKFNYNYETLAKFSMDTYLGKDHDENCYWSSSRTIMVFNKNGKLLNLFRFDEDKSNTYPAVSPSGDIYFMGYGTDNVTLYKIKRQW